MTDSTASFLHDSHVSMSMGVGRTSNQAASGVDRFLARKRGIYSSCDLTVGTMAFCISGSNENRKLMISRR